MKPFPYLVGVAAALLALGCVSAFTSARTSDKKYEVTHTRAEWHKILAPAAFDVLRNAGTEEPWTGKLLNVHEPGTFVCAGCGQKLFRSDTKFDSGTGWPSFWAPISPKAIDKVEDLSDGMDRTEVRCARCGGHLGHVFDDGPKPTGLRFCMNSAAMKFIPDDPKKKPIPGTAP